MCLLQGRRSRYLLAGKRLIMILASLSITTGTIWTHQLWRTSDNNNYNNHPQHDMDWQAPFSRLYLLQPRQLFQELPSRSYSDIYAAATINTGNLIPKPIMMGVLWPQREGDDDYYQDHDILDTKAGLEVTQGLVVSIDPYTYHVVPAASSKTPTTRNTIAYKSRKAARRSILPPNYDTLFPPFRHGRSVTFDINYTMPYMYDPSREERDEGMKWPIPEGCEMQYKWQSESHPTCNHLHEQDVPAELTTTFSSGTGKAQAHDSLRAQLLAAGGYRNVWMIHNGTQVVGGGGHKNTTTQVTRDPPIALKTLLYERDWYEVQYARHNLDALVASRLQSSPYILNLYGYCGTSGMYEFAQGGNLKGVTETYYKQYNPRTKLELAYNVAHAIADLHNMAKEGVPVVSHTDIFPDQFVRIRDDTSIRQTPFKLNDFNRARWVNLPTQDAPRNVTKESCGFTFPRNRGKFRSPEEYNYQLETEQVDVYSMGNIFYFLLVGEFPFAARSRDTVKRTLKEGKRQRIPDEYANSEDPMIQAVVEAIRMSWIQIPADRATARQVERHLGRVMNEHGMGW